MVEPQKETTMSDNPRPDDMPEPTPPAEPTVPPQEAPMPGGDVDIPAPGSSSDAGAEIPGAAIR